MKKKSTHTGEWVFCCAHCGVLELSSRRDATTCSPACRVAFHRHGSEFRAIAASLHVPLATVGHVAAIKRLVPDAAAPLTAGTKSIDDVMPEAVRAFYRMVFKLAELPD